MFEQERLLRKIMRLVYFASYTKMGQFEGGQAAEALESGGGVDHAAKAASEPV